jgi:hypothetical protein
LIDAVLRASIKEARAASDFDRLVDLAAFYQTELGVPPRTDAFYAELRDALESAAKDVAKTSANRRVFILTLLAEGFPGEPAGQAAQKEAVAAGMAAAGAVPQESASTGAQAPGEKLGPSGLDGLSVVSIENRTPYHILAFYDGPERFFVRLNPRRRGSAALLDGAYAVGVMASDDSVVPYRNQIAYAGERIKNNYVIETTGGGKWQSRVPYEQSSGDWKLLRAPPRGALVVDRHTGEVRAER